MGKNHTDILGEQTAFCARHREERADKGGAINESRGVFLFPNDRTSLQTRGSTVMTGIKGDDIIKYADDSRVMDVWIFGCVIYDEGRENTVHQTGFIFQIARTIDRQNASKALLYGVPLNEIVAEKDVILFPVPSAEGQTN